MGGAASDVALAGAASTASGELHFWSDPPRVIYVGRGDPPLLDGRVFEQAPLSAGASIQWAGAVLVYGCTPVIEEIDPEPELDLGASASGHGAEGVSPGLPSERDVVADRVKSGLLADLNLTDKTAVNRWRKAVMTGEFDSDACSRELLAGASDGPADVRLLQRATRLQRDLLMSAHTRGIRGAGRRARAAGRSGAAYVVANLIAISIYSFVMFLLMIMVRSQYGTSFDGTLDSILDLGSKILGGSGDGAP